MLKCCEKYSGNSQKASLPVVFCVTAQKMNPSILGMAMQQSQEKDRLRCKQGIPQQIAPQVRGQTAPKLLRFILSCTVVSISCCIEVFFLAYLVILCCISGVQFSFSLSVTQSHTSRCVCVLRFRM